MLKPYDICSLSCFENKEFFSNELHKVRCGTANEISIPLELDGKYTIKYAPVGNYPEDPHIIICGKTTSKDSHKDFIEALQKGKSIHEACFSTIYANKMRDNLFQYLFKVGLFDYLGNFVPYWSTNNLKKKWDSMFNNIDDSLSSGIQLTQAFNCAILNNNGSSEPEKKVINVIQNNIGCLFKQFRISDNLKLIIFLDTPGDNRFHQIDYWNKSQISKNQYCKTISITHPGKRNTYIFNLLDDFSQIKETMRPNVEKLFENAKSTIEDLSKELEKEGSKWI